MNFDIFNEMTINELERFLETGEVPVRTDVNGKLPKDTGFNKDKGDVPVMDNEVETKKGQDPVKATKGDVEDFEKEKETDDISLENFDIDALLGLSEACKKEEAEEEDEEDEECCKSKKSPKKVPVEADEVEEENEALEEDFDVDAEFDALLREEDEELLAFDEDLNDIESFLENYIDEE